MTAEARAERLLAYAQGPAHLRECLVACPEEALDYRPAPGKWTVREVVFHLAEAELQGYLRARTIMAQPRSPIPAYDQDAWASSLDPTHPLEEALELFRLLREILARQLRGLPESAWSQWVLHPERGEVSLERWLEIYEKHLGDHLAQIARNLETWRRR